MNLKEMIVQCTYVVQCTVVELFRRGRNKNTMGFHFQSLRWLEFGLVNRTGAKVRDLYFLKALSLECSK